MNAKEQAIRVAVDKIASLSADLHALDVQVDDLVRQRAACALALFDARTALRRLKKDANA
ncbi:MAG: hypothetical protein GY832_44580 [Chloroflexi bacterium]|nr:hypothetical protein [Chloroflexota bacterium]